MTKLIESLPEEAWIRICQECGNKQEDKTSPANPSYKERKCNKCKSPALDWGRCNASYYEELEEEKALERE